MQCVGVDGSDLFLTSLMWKGEGDLGTSSLLPPPCGIRLSAGLQAYSTQQVLHPLRPLTSPASVNLESTLVGERNHATDRATLIARATQKSLLTFFIFLMSGFFFFPTGTRSSFVTLASIGLCSLLCSSGWPQTCKNLAASSSQVHLSV